MKVTILTPVYNQGGFLRETIESVLSQDYADVEYIVLDDGSTDQTPEILKTYGARLNATSHPNMGETKTVNRGYSLANGDIVGVINSDDPLHVATAISRIVACFKDNPDAVAVYPDWISIDGEGAILSEMVLPQYTIENMLEGFNVALGPGVFIKLDVLRQLGFRDESIRYTGDLDLSFRLALLGKFAHVSEKLATHRVHAQAASSAAQGVVMANEVVALARRCLASPLLPDHLAKRKRKILAYASAVASSYCGENSRERARLIREALALDATLLIEMLFGSKRTNSIPWFGLLRFPRARKLMTRTNFRKMIRWL
jgi:hypothetical protein